MNPSHLRETSEHNSRKLSHAWIFTYIFVWSTNQIFTDYTLLTQNKNAWGNQPFNIYGCLQSQQHTDCNNNPKKVVSSQAGSKGSMSHKDIGTCPQHVRVCTQMSPLWFFVKSGAFTGLLKGYYLKHFPCFLCPYIHFPALGPFCFPLHPALFSLHGHRHNWRNLRRPPRKLAKKWDQHYWI